MEEEIKEEERSADEAGMHEIKEEERSADEAGMHANDVVVDVYDDPWVKQMEEKLTKQCQASHPFTICKVPRDIRGVDSVAHDPLVVSIGPYHRGSQSLLDMEQVKWRNLNAFRDLAGKDFKDYLKEMKEIEPRARDCYSGEIHMEGDEFIEMMLLDGLFMIGLFMIDLISTRDHFFRGLLLQLFNMDKEEPIYSISGMLCRVGRDMLLLENQLPFFVLERLWKLTDHQSSFDLWESACVFIRDYALRFEHEWNLNRLREIFDEEEEKKKENPEMINEDGVHHLLHLVYLLLKPTTLASTKKSRPMESEPTSGSSSESNWTSSGSMEPTAKLLAVIKKIPAKLPAVVKKIPLFLSPSKSEEERPPPLAVIPSAVELDEAGVVFKCVKAKSFLDVRFEKGKMKMPRLSVVDSTKPLLRNFIAYEQCFPDQGDHITSYCSFMDELVNTPRDVEILKKSAIIENRVGSDEEVALLFNDLCKGTFVSGFEDSYLAESFDQVTKHTQKTWPKWRAKLKHDYFSNPWAIISLIAAAFVIFLTSVQTYYAAFT